MKRLIFAFIVMFGAIQFARAQGYEENIVVASENEPQSREKFGDSTLNGIPSGSHYIKLRFGNINAVSGDMDLHIPLGPTLPGRIPIGFAWDFKTDRAFDYYSNLLYYEGRYSPILWPYVEESRATISFYYNGKEIIFYKSGFSIARKPEWSLVKSWLQKRGMTDFSRFVNPNIHIGADGTSFFVVQSNAYNPAMAVILGETAIWTNGFEKNSVNLYDSRRTYVGNIWGDLVLQVENFPIMIDHRNNNYATWGAPTKIRISNIKKENHWIELNVSINNIDHQSDLAALSITNGFGGITISGSGLFKFRRKIGWIGDPKDPTRYFNKLFLMDSEYAYLPFDFLIKDPISGKFEKIEFEWDKLDGSYNDNHSPDEIAKGSMLPLKSIRHQDGLFERFEWEKSHSIGKFSYHLAYGTWYGWLPSKRYFDSLIYYNYPYQGIVDSDYGVNDSLKKAVRSVTFSGPGVSSHVKIAREFPVLKFISCSNMNALKCEPVDYVAEWPQPRHTTSILYYDTENPGNSSRFRGYRLIHPSGGGIHCSKEPSSLSFLCVARSSIREAARHRSPHGSSGRN